MDDALSKPLSVQAIRDVISRYSIQCVSDEHALLPSEPEPKSAVSELAGRLLDLEMLNSYIDIVGTKPVLDSIEMFESMMPGYVEILDSNMTAKDQDGIVSEAHKIKGAAGSIGLKHIQSVAQKAQSPQLTAWWENINDWVEEIKNEYPHDIGVLKEWLENR
jgi:two-component system aerobic respiration control sensor histidine kinase ArcB